MKIQWWKVTLFFLVLAFAVFWMAPRKRQWAGLFDDAAPTEENERALRDLLRADPDDPKLLRSLGRMLVARGDHAGAIVELERVALREPRDPALHRELAELYGATKKLDRQAEHLEALLRLESTDAATRAALVDVYLALAEGSQALLHLTRLRDEGATLKDDHQAAFVTLLAERKQFADAIAIQAARLARRPEDVALRTTLADLYEWSGDPARAAEEIEALAAAHPDRPEFPRRLLSLLFALPQPTDRDLARAATAFAAVVARTPEDRPLWDAYRSFLTGHRRGADAVALLERMLAVAAFRDEPALHKLAAELAVQFELTEAARRHFPALLAAQPDDRAAWDAWVGYLTGHGFGPEALEALAALQSHAPADLDVMRRRAALAVQLSLHADAIAITLELLRVAPDDDAARKALAQLYLWTSQPRRWLEQMEDLSRRHPDDLAFHRDLATRYEEMKFAEPALQHVVRLAEAEPDNADLLRRLVALSRYIGDSPRAEDALRRWLRTHPDDRQAWTDLAHLATDDLRMDDAREAWQHLLALEPAHAEAVRALAYDALAHGRLDEAARWFQAWSEREPEAEAVAAQVEALALARRDPEAILAALLRALARRPRDARVHRQLAECYQSLGRLDDAIRHYQALAELTPGASSVILDLVYRYIDRHEEAQAIALLQSLREHGPMGENGEDTLVWLLQRAGRLDEAEAEVTALLVAKPPPARAIALHVLQAETYRLQGRRDRAIAEFLIIAEQAGDNPATLNEAAQALLGYDQIEHSRALFERVLRADPDNLTALSFLGRLAAYRNDATSAFRYWTRFNELDGRDFDVRFMLGELLYERLQPGAAFEQHTRALALIAESGEHSKLTRTIVARIAGRRGDHAVAVGAYEALLKEYPDDPNLWEDALETLVLLKAYDRALELAGRLRQRFPNTVRAPRLVARVYLENDRPEEAAVLLRQVLARYPDDAGVKSDLAAVIESAGEWHEALTHFQDILERDPGHDEAWDNTRRLLARYRPEASFLYGWNEGTEDRIAHADAWLRVQTGNRSFFRLGTRHLDASGTISAIDRDWRDGLMEADAMFGWEPDPRWRLGLGVVETFGGQADGLGAYARARYRDELGNTWGLTLTGNETWRDSVETLYFGGRQDTAETRFLLFPTPWLDLHGSARAARFRIESDRNPFDDASDDGWASTLSAGATLYLWNRPRARIGDEFFERDLWEEDGLQEQLSLSYDFTGLRYHGGEADDRLIPLVGVSDAHTLRLTWSQPLNEWMGFRSAAFLTHDEPRDIHALRADVYGFENDVHWRLFERGLLTFSHQWTTENAFEGSAGVSQTFEFGLNVQF